MRIISCGVNDRVMYHYMLSSIGYAESSGLELNMSVKNLCMLQMVQLKSLMYQVSRLTSHVDLLTDVTHR